MEIVPKQETFLQQDNYIEVLRDTLRQKQMLDEHNNLNFGTCERQRLLGYVLQIEGVQQGKGAFQTHPSGLPTGFAGDRRLSWSASSKF